MAIKFWSRSATAADATAAADQSDSEPSVVHDGELAYTRVKAGNGSSAAYQEAVGAPVESKSPLGYHVGWMTIIFLNVNQMIGTGIFSTREFMLFFIKNCLSRHAPGKKGKEKQSMLTLNTAATVLNRTGSVGLALIYWLIGVIMAIAGVCIYLELASYFPNRSGGEVVYLEQAYPRPKHFFPIAFAVQSVILSFSSSNAIVLSRYVWRIAGTTPTEWEMRGVAIAAYTLAVVCVVAHNKYSLWATNVIGALKIATLVFISITGFVILGGNVGRIPDPHRNFRNAFEGTTTDGNSLSVALVNIVFSYTGYSNAFNMVNEIRNPIPKLKKYATASVLIVSVLYMLCNVAYFAAVSKSEFAASKEIAAAVFFTTVFGRGGAETALNVLVLLSAFGNLLAVLIGSSRMIREIGRQGVLPYTEFWVSTRPFGTPLGPYLLKWAVTFIMIVAPPAGDAFQFVVSLKTYPDGVFHLAMAIGVYLIRRRRKRAGMGKTEFQAWDVVVVFFILLQVYIIAMPWWPPKGGIYAGEVSFFYATYCLVGIAM